MTFKGIVLRLRNGYIRLTKKARRKKIKCDDFTIISNNCWGGLVYESYNLPKNSPTVGMYFISEEYLKFVSNLKYYLTECKISFVDANLSKHKDFYSKDSRFGSFPIAVLGDVEIAMLHFHSEQEVVEKWERRVKRINWERLIVKMNDQNQCNEEIVCKFCQLSYKNLLFFTVNHKYKDITNVVCLSKKSKPSCGLFDEPFGASKKFNVNKYINKLVEKEEKV